MGRIDWARAAQFNWAFDNMGGTPLQEAVAGNWQGAVALVEDGGRITLTAPNPGGGQVYFIRGIYAVDTVFPWNGFWADPLSGDLTNYYQGGSFSNQGEATIITLGTPLAAETPVQLYYIYLTGKQAARYEPLNNYPCIRRASRSRDDYTYDFAVDRLLDLMACLHFAGSAQGQDYTPLLRFLWEAFIGREQSRTSPLLRDSFERQFWDRGEHLMYRGASPGIDAFQVFQSEVGSGGPGRVLHARVRLPASTDAAWFGYGLDWSLEAAPFTGVDRLSFKLQGPAGTLRVHNLTKIGSGSASLILRGDYARQEKRRFVVYIQSTGAVGAATFQWSKDGGLTWEAGGLISGDRQHPVALWAGLEVYWEGGPGTHLVAGDYWTFWAGEPATHPRKLLVILNDSPSAAEDPWGPAHTYVHALPDRFVTLTPLELPFSQFWRRDNLIEDGDRVTAMWGAWYSATQPDASDITIGTREETEVLFGETFYTQRLVTWDLSPYATAFGVWAGIDPGRVDSSGHTQVNFLVRAVVAGVASLTLRVKVKDAHGSYFYQDVTVPANTWRRVTVALSDLQLESGAAPLVHPLQVIDLGITSNPPSNGAFYLTDLKFGEHLTFAGANHLRVLEFKIEQQGLEEHEWWLDDISLNLEAQDPYPYAPRLAISLTPYGQNPWRGPTLVHYAHPLAPFLAGALNLAQTYVQLHADAQDEFHHRYGGVKGPIMPVHTRNDIENIAILGCENFNKFCWWPDYPEAGSGLGQYWAFMKLAQYHFVSGDEQAWDVLDNWLNWLDTYGTLENPVDQPVIDVTNPGHGLAAATGDGSTDDTANLQAIIDYAKDNGFPTVWFPNGTYIVKKAGANPWCVQLHPGLTLLGQSQAGVIIKRAPIGGGWRAEERLFAAMWVGFTSDTALLSISYMTFDGNGHDLYHDEHSELIELNAASDTSHRGRLKAEVHHCTFQNEPESSGLFIGTNVDAVYHDLTFTDNVGTGTRHCQLTHEGANTIGVGSNLTFNGAANYYVETGPGAQGWDPTLGQTYYLNLTLTNASFPDHTSLSLGFPEGLSDGSTFTGSNIQGASFQGVFWSDFVGVISNSTFYQTTSGDIRVYNPGNWTFNNSTFYATAINESEGYVSCFPWINWNFIQTLTGQRITFNTCTFDVYGTPSVIIGAVPTAGFNVPSDDNAVVFTNCTFTNKIHYCNWNYTGMGGKWIFTTCTFNNDAVGSVAGVDKYPLLFYGYNAPTYGAPMDMTIDGGTWNAARFARIPGDVGLCETNNLRIRNLTLTGTQNVVGTTYGISGNTFSRVGGGAGILRTINGSGDPVTDRPAGFAGIEVYDRFVSGGTNYKCTASGVGGVATWALE